MHCKPASSARVMRSQIYGWPAPLRRAFRLKPQKGLGDRHPRDGKTLSLIDRPISRRVRPVSFFAFHTFRFAFWPISFVSTNPILSHANRDTLLDAIR
jgi:hypothetical protein